MGTRPAVVTLQLGQAGNQLGAQLYSTLAEELQAGQGEGGKLGPGAGTFFYEAAVGGEARLTARSVLLDTEPRAVHAALQAGRGRWHYSRLSQLTRQGGSGSNWAAGFGWHGPQMRSEALNMVRRQVERCDSLGGFLLLHSLAGGTGSGLGSCMAALLRDEYPAAPMLSHAIWPYEAGECTTQPYNTLLSLVHLSQAADGVVLVGNEALSAACRGQLGVQRPTFADMNALASRDLGSLLLPSTVRPPAAGPPAGQEVPGGRRSHGSASASGRRLSAGAGSRGVAAHTNDASGRSGSGAVAWDGSFGIAGSSDPSEAWDGTFAARSRWEEEGGGGWGGRPGRPGRGSSGLGSSTMAGQLRVLEDICQHLCAHPSYRLLTLRSVPQMPPGSLDFTTFSWPVLLKRLGQMAATGRTVDTGAEGSAWLSSVMGSRGSSGGGIKSLSSLLVLRGVQAREADAAAFLDPALTPSWQPEPLLVAASSRRFAKLDMCATLLTNCQTPVAPISRMLGKARCLHQARAYLHQYERHGVGCAELEAAFEAADDIITKYRAM